MSLWLALFSLCAWAAPIVKDVPAPEIGGRIVPVIATPLIPTPGALAAANLTAPPGIAPIPPELPLVETTAQRITAPTAAAIEAAANRDESALEEPARADEPQAAPEIKAAEAAQKFDRQKPLSELPAAVPEGGGSQRYHYAFTPSQRTPAPALRLNAASRNPNVLDYLKSRSFKDHIKEARRLAIETAGGASSYAIKVLLRDVPPGEKINGHTRGHPIKKQSIRMTVGPEPSEYDDTDVQSTLFHEHGHAVLNVFLHKRKSAGQLALDRGYEMEKTKLKETAAGKRILARAKLYHAFADPSREAFADVFRILVMRAPGSRHRPRDFSKMEEDIGGFGGEKHLELNPFRAHLWNDYLKGKLDDADYRARVLRVLAQVCFEVPEHRFLAALHGGPKTEDGASMNQEFIDAFDAAMATQS